MALRHLLRRLLRAPMFTGVTLLTLALSIGANIAIFSVINGLLLKPLPYADAERLVSVWQTAPDLNLKDVNASPSDYFTFREENRVFQDLGIWDSGSASVTGLGEPEQIRTINVTVAILPLLGVQPILGRWFTAKDDSPGSPDTAILAYPYWQRRFGADRSVLGRRIVLNGKACQIVGVLPQNFRFPGQNPDLLLAFQLDRNKVQLGNFSYQAIARLKPGVTLAQANADVARMIPMVNDRFPPPPGFSAKMFAEARILPSVRPLTWDVVGDIGTSLWVVMGTIGIVLLIACANVANLLLVRAEGRQQELAIRTALGAAWTRIARELLTESLFLGILGGALGLGLAYEALRLLVAVGPATLPRLDNIGIDPAVLLFTLAVSLFAGLLFGLIPVIKYASPHIATALHGSTRSVSQSRERHRARNTLVVIQVALALVLLISSGLMIRTFQAMRHVEPGFTHPESLQTLQVSIPESQVRDADATVRMLDEMRRGLARIPGASSAAFSNSIPTDGHNSNDLVYAEDQAYAENQIPPIRRFKFITPGFFRTMGNPMVAGRDFDWTDLYSRRPVAVVSENLAREMWRTPSAALGKRIRESRKDPWREIVGVVGDVHDDGADRKAPPIVYWPLLMTDFWGSKTFVQRYVIFAIRTDRAGSESFLKEARQAVWAQNSNLPIARIRTMEEVYSSSMARASFTLVMLAIAGAMALLLGLIGIYGVISYAVSQRTREIGIRMALGAQQGSVEQMFVRHGLMLAAIGVASGLGVAIAVMRVMKSLLFEVQPVDPLTYGAVSIGLVLAAMAASYLPARKASTVDPVQALRTE